jgi:hypothetical protein
MRTAIPDTIRPLPLDRPEHATRELAAILCDLREGAAADLEVVAAEAVDAAREQGAFLMAVVTPPNAAPAMLTGVVLETAPPDLAQTADRLRDSLEDTGGPDVRETIMMDTGLGPAVLVQRIPGIEQARAGRPLTVQLQAFLPEPTTGRTILLTLASPSPYGWADHQRLFGELVASACGPASRSNELRDEESFEHHTYQL